LPELPGLPVALGPPGPLEPPVAPGPPALLERLLLPSRRLALECLALQGRPCRPSRQVLHCAQVPPEPPAALDRLCPRQVLEARSRLGLLCRPRGHCTRKQCRRRRSRASFHPLGNSDLPLPVTEWRSSPPTLLHRRWDPAPGNLQRVHSLPLPPR